MCLKGVVVCSEHIELNFEEIKAMADKLMYADKDEYYRRTGKDRRQSLIYKLIFNLCKEPNNFQFFETEKSEFIKLLILKISLKNY